MSATLIVELRASAVWLRPLAPELPVGAELTGVAVEAMRGRGWGHQPWVVADDAREPSSRGITACHFGSREEAQGAATAAVEALRTQKARVAVAGAATSRWWINEMRARGVDVVALEVHPR